MREADGPGALARTEAAIARALLWVVTLVFGAACAWEIGAPFGAGHYAASSAVGLAGENTWRFGTALPVTHHPFGPLTAADYYTHHPFGIFWVQALFAAVFGEHDWVCRVPAVLESAFTPLLVFLVGRSLYGPLAAALGALFFAATPIALAFGNLNGLEVPVIFGTLLASWAVLRLHETGRARYLYGALGALGFALNADWAAFVFSAALVLVVGGSCLAAKELPNRRMLLRFVAFAIALTLAVGLSYVVALAMLGRLDELFAQGRARTLGFERPLDAIAARRYWVLLMFTPVALAVGVLAVPAFAMRALKERRGIQLLPLAVLIMAIFQYVVFKEGADVHIYWPHYFAPYCALGFAALVRSVADFVRQGHRALVFSLGVLVPAAMIPDAATALVYARKTGGRFNERGNFIQPDKDKVAAFSRLSATLPAHATVALAPNIRQSTWVPWVLSRPVRTEGGVRAFSEDYFVTDARFEAASALGRVAFERAVHVIGPFWVVPRDGAPAPLVASSVTRREPTDFERFWLSGTHALRSVAPDAYLTWELRDHLRQVPNPMPASAPASHEALRSAHNVAVSRGDHRLAASLLEQLLSGVDRAPERVYEDGTHLLGVRFEPGTSDVLTVYFRAAGALEERFVIESRVVAGPGFSLVPRDTLPWRVGLPPAIPTPWWKAGYVYGSVTELLRRPGRERYSGRWERLSRARRGVLEGAEEVSLIELP